MFEGERFAQWNVDGVANDGYSESIADYLWEECGVRNTRGLEPEERQMFFLYIYSYNKKQIQ